MARYKNALRQHYIAEVDGTNEPTGGDWLRLAKWITDISDDTTEDTETNAYYDGDGTPETDVTSVAIGYAFSGTYDKADPAQALIAGLKLKTGEDRIIWHKVIEAGGEKEYVGLAVVTDIIAGAGPAEGYEEFSCNITYKEIPDYQNAALYGNAKFVAADGSSNPVAGVIVKIGGQMKATGEDGVLLWGLPAGNHDWTAAISGTDTVSPASGTVTVTAGEDKEVELTVASG